MACGFHLHFLGCHFLCTGASSWDSWCRGDMLHRLAKDVSWKHCQNRQSSAVDCFCQANALRDAKTLNQEAMEGEMVRCRDFGHSEVCSSHGFVLSELNEPARG